MIIFSKICVKRGIMFTSSVNLYSSASLHEVTITSQSSQMTESKGVDSTVTEYSLSTHYKT